MRSQTWPKNPSQHPLTLLTSAGKARRSESKQGMVLGDGGLQHSLAVLLQVEEIALMFTTFLRVDGRRLYCERWVELGGWG